MYVSRRPQKGLVVRILSCSWRRSCKDISRAIHPAVKILSRPHWCCDRTRLAQLRRQVGEFAQQRPRVARINNVLDQEGFGSAEWRAIAVEPLLDLAAQRLAIGRGIELGPIRGLDAALHGERTPVAGGPGVAV